MIQCNAVVEVCILMFVLQINIKSSFCKQQENSNVFVQCYNLEFQDGYYKLPLSKEERILTSVVCQNTSKDGRYFEQHSQTNSAFHLLLSSHLQNVSASSSTLFYNNGTVFRLRCFTQRSASLIQDVIHYMCQYHLPKSSHRRYTQHKTTLIENSNDASFFSNTCCFPCELKNNLSKNGMEEQSSHLVFKCNLILNLNKTAQFSFITRRISSRGSSRIPLSLNRRSLHYIDCSPQCRGACVSSNGTCKPCAPGYQGAYCNATCSLGFYGNGCVHRCPKFCLQGQCHHRTGHCFGCTPGYLGDYCNVQCIPGYYGNYCTNMCSEMCKNQLCDFRSGHCFNCLPGYFGPMCSNICPPKTFGSNCSFLCSKYCQTECNRATGECAECVLGYAGALCNETCSKGRYGPGCNLVCSDGCLNNECSHIEGSCFQCKPMLTGMFCLQNISIDDINRWHKENDNRSTIDNANFTVNNLITNIEERRDKLLFWALIAAISLFGVISVCVIGLLLQTIRARRQKDQAGHEKHVKTHRLETSPRESSRRYPHNTRYSVVDSDSYTDSDESDSDLAPSYSTETETVTSSKTHFSQAKLKLEQRTAIGERDELSTLSSVAPLTEEAISIHTNIQYQDGLVKNFKAEYSINSTKPDCGMGSNVINNSTPGKTCPKILCKQSCQINPTPNLKEVLSQSPLASIKSDSEAPVSIGGNNDKLIVSSKSECVFYKADPSSIAASMDAVINNYQRKVSNRMDIKFKENKHLAITSKDPLNAIKDIENTVSTRQVVETANCATHEAKETPKSSDRMFGTREKCEKETLANNSTSLKDASPCSSNDLLLASGQNESSRSDLIGLTEALHKLYRQGSSPVRKLSRDDSSLFFSNSLPVPLSTKLTSTSFVSSNTSPVMLSQHSDGPAARKNDDTEVSTKSASMECAREPKASAAPILLPQLSENKMEAKDETKPSNSLGSDCAKALPQIKSAQPKDSFSKATTLPSSDNRFYRPISTTLPIVYPHTVNKNSRTSSRFSTNPSLCSENGYNRKPCCHTGSEHDRPAPLTDREERPILDALPNIDPHSSRSDQLSMKSPQDNQGIEASKDQLPIGFDPTKENSLEKKAASSENILPKPISTALPIPYSNHARTIANTSVQFLTKQSTPSQGNEKSKGSGPTEPDNKKTKEDTLPRSISKELPTPFSNCIGKDSSKLSQHSMASIPSSLAVDSDKATTLTATESKTCSQDTYFCKPASTETPVPCSQLVKSISTISCKLSKSDATRVEAIDHCRGTLSAEVNEHAKNCYSENTTKYSENKMNNPMTTATALPTEKLPTYPKKQSDVSSLHSKSCPPTTHSVDCGTRTTPLESYQTKEEIPENKVVSSEESIYMSTSADIPYSFNLGTISSSHSTLYKAIMPTEPSDSVHQKPASPNDPPVPYSPNFVKTISSRLNQLQINPPFRSKSMERNPISAVSGTGNGNSPDNKRMSSACELQKPKSPPEVPIPHSHKVKIISTRLNNLPMKCSSYNGSVERSECSTTVGPFHGSECPSDKAIILHWEEKHIPVSRDSTIPNKNSMQSASSNPEFEKGPEPVKLECKATSSGSRCHKQIMHEMPSPCSQVVQGISIGQNQSVSKRLSSNIIDQPSNVGTSGSGTETDNSPVSEFITPGSRFYKRLSSEFPYSHNVKLISNRLNQLALKRSSYAENVECDQSKAPTENEQERESPNEDKTYSVHKTIETDQLKAGSQNHVLFCSIENVEGNDDIAPAGQEDKTSSETSFQTAISTELPTPHSQTPKKLLSMSNKPSPPSTSCSQSVERFESVTGDGHFSSETRRPLSKEFLNDIISNVKNKCNCGKGITEAASDQTKERSLENNETAQKKAVDLQASSELLRFNSHEIGTRSGDRGVGNDEAFLSSEQKNKMSNWEMKCNWLLSTDPLGSFSHNTRTISTKSDEEEVDLLECDQQTGPSESKHGRERSLEYKPNLSENISIGLPIPYSMIPSTNNLHSKKSPSCNRQLGHNKSMMDTDPQRNGRGLNENEAHLQTAAGPPGTVSSKNQQVVEVCEENIGIGLQQETRPVETSFLNLTSRPSSAPFQQNVGTISSIESQVFLPSSNQDVEYTKVISPIDAKCTKEPSPGIKEYSEKTLQVQMAIKVPLSEQDFFETEHAETLIGSNPCEQKDEQNKDLLPTDLDRDKEISLVSNSTCPENISPKSITGRLPILYPNIMRVALSTQSKDDVSIESEHARSGSQETQILPLENRYHGQVSADLPPPYPHLVRKNSSNQSIEHGEETVLNALENTLQEPPASTLFPTHFHNPNSYASCSSIPANKRDCQVNTSPQLSSTVQHISRGRTIHCGHGTDRHRDILSADPEICEQNDKKCHIAQVLIELPRSIPNNVRTSTMDKCVQYDQYIFPLENPNEIASSETRYQGSGAGKNQSQCFCALKQTVSSHSVEQDKYSVSFGSERADTVNLQKEDVVHTEKIPNVEQIVQVGSVYTKEICVADETDHQQNIPQMPMTTDSSYIERCNPTRLNSSSEAFERDQQDSSKEPQNENITLQNRYHGQNRDKLSILYPNIVTPNSSYHQIQHDEHTMNTESMQSNDDPAVSKVSKSRFPNTTSLYTGLFSKNLNVTKDSESNKTEEQSKENIPGASESKHRNQLMSLCARMFPKSSSQTNKIETEQAKYDSAEDKGKNPESSCNKKPVSWYERLFPKRSADIQGSISEQTQGCFPETKPATSKPKTKRQMSLYDLLFSKQPNEEDNEESYKVLVVPDEEIDKTSENCPNMTNIDGFSQKKDLPHTSVKISHKHLTKSSSREVIDTSNYLSDEIDECDSTTLMNTDELYSQGSRVYLIPRVKTSKPIWLPFMSSSSSSQCTSTDSETSNPHTSVHSYDTSSSWQGLGLPALEKDSGIRFPIRPRLDVVDALSRHTHSVLNVQNEPSTSDVTATMKSEVLFLKSYINLEENSRRGSFLAQKTENVIPRRDGIACGIKSAWGQENDPNKPLFTVTTEDYPISGYLQGPGKRNMPCGIAASPPDQNPLRLPSRSQISIQCAHATVKSPPPVQQLFECNSPGTIPSKSQNSTLSRNQNQTIRHKESRSPNQSSSRVEREPSARDLLTRRSLESVSEDDDETAPNTFLLRYNAKHWSKIPIPSKWHGSRSSSPVSRSNIVRCPVTRDISPQLQPSPHNQQEQQQQQQQQQRQKQEQQQQHQHQ